jgi:hypothetical protein
MYDRNALIHTQNLYAHEGTVVCSFIYIDVSDRIRQIASTVVEFVEFKSLNFLKPQKLLLKKIFMFCEVYDSRNNQYAILHSFNLFLHIFNLSMAY